MLTVMRTDRGSLRLFEIETQGMVSKSKVLTNNNCEKKNHSIEFNNFMIFAIYSLIHTFFVSRPFSLWK